MRCRRLKEKFYKATITASIICLKTRCWQIYDSFSAPGISCLLTRDFNTTAPHFTSSTAVKHTNVTSTQIPRQCLISGSTCQGLFLFFLVHLWWQFCAHIVPHTSSPSALSLSHWQHIQGNVAVYCEEPLQHAADLFGRASCTSAWKTTNWNYLSVPSYSVLLLWRDGPPPPPPPPLPGALAALAGCAGS